MKAALALVAVLNIGAISAASAADSNAGSANSGANNGAAACAACHGANGAGNPAAGAPRLAGQPAAYLSRQLQAYADGSRKNATMQPIAQSLSAEQRDRLAAYFSSLDAPTAKQGLSTPENAARARTLVTVGDEQLRVQGCQNCHGPGGAGMSPYPYLAGQVQTYLRAALGEWKSGARATDPSGQMQTIAKRLSDSDMAALSAFFAAQPPPTVARAQPAPTGAAGAASTPTSPNAASQPSSGTGTEGGSPTTGGSQGTSGTTGSAASQSR